MDSLVIPNGTEELFISHSSKELNSIDDSKEEKNLFLEHLWMQFLVFFEKEKGKRVINNWFKSLQIISWNQNKKIVSLYAPNEFIKKWLESNYLFLIEKIFARLLNEKKISILFFLSQKIPDVIKEKNGMTFRPAVKEKENSTDIVETSLFNSIEQHINHAFTMDQFLITKSNETVISAIHYFIEKNNSWNNTLFLYGAQNTGKTHLLQGMRDLFLRKNRSCMYIHGDTFLKQYIQAARMKKIPELERILSQVSILMIDDVEILRNKKYTQEFLLKIVTEFNLQKKKIIFVGKSIPKYITGLTQLLLEKLEEGLVFHFEKLTAQDIKNILYLKATYYQYEIDDVLINYIAELPDLNPLQAENILHRIMTESIIKKKKVTLDLLKISINELQIVLPNKENKKEQKKDILFVLDKIRQIFIFENHMLKNTRRKEYIKIKYLAIYILRTILHFPCIEVAKYFGYKDHTTLSYACKIFEKLYKEEEDMKKVLSFFF